MFRLHTSNDAARLADALGRQLCGPRANPLVPARVLVPQAGLKRWLQVYLAERHGVIANVAFTPPAQFAWELLRAARPDLPERSPFEVEVLRWHLYALLGERLDGAALAPLRDYLAADADPLRRDALAFELARAYERMQGYRREQLAAWERGGGGGWQAELWRRLLPRVGAVSRATRVDEWLRAHDPAHAAHAGHAAPVPPGLPRQFACFACANVSPDVLRMLAVAGLHADVDFFLPLPSKEYLGDTPTSRTAVHARLLDKDGGNPLVISLGGALAEFVDLLFGYQQVQPDVEHDDYADIDRSTLLGRVRDDILQHAAPRAAERATTLDASLQFHACHTPLREVETLHDALLDLFQARPDLQPRDVAVMMPDVAAYRPAIEAVFGGVPRGDPRHLPYNLGDLGAAALHPAAELFLKLLDAPASRWRLDELTDVLAATGVMRRFDLDADAVARLRQRLLEAGARWGEDEDAHARAGAGKYREFSWAFAVDRIVAGFATGDADAALVGDTAPLAGVEGQAFAHLDALLAVTDTWRRLGHAAAHPRPAAAWQNLLNECFDGLYQPDPDDLAETRTLERVRTALARLAADCREADPALALPWSVLRVHLVTALADPDPAQRLFSGGVTFCGMVPLRVVPFRVVCLLGMGADAFPRREAGGLDPLAADRRAGKAWPGDRDVRADDRLLFLQLLAAARDAFYVSWVGRDVRSNKDLPPSAVVAELLRSVREDYLAPGAAADALPWREPLHPFATALFDGATRTRSHAVEWKPAAATHVRTDAAPRFVATALPAADGGGDITLADLKRFFDHPARAFLEHGLALRLPRAASVDADIEPLQPDEPLLRYTLTRALLSLGEAGAEAERAQLKAAGLLPPGALGDAALAIARERKAVLADEVVAFTDGAAAQTLAGQIPLSTGASLIGQVEGLYPGGLLRAEPGKLHGKRALRAWIDTLFAAAISDAPIGCHLLGIDKQDGTPSIVRMAFNPIAPDAARTRLRQLVGLLHQGLRAPLPFMPKIAWSSLKCERKGGRADAAEFCAHFASTAGRDEHGFGGWLDLDDEAVAMAWRGVDLTDPRALHPWFALAASVLPPPDAVAFPGTPRGGQR